LRSLRSTFCAIQIELFRFRYPITSATEAVGTAPSPVANALKNIQSPMFALAELERVIAIVRASVPSTPLYAWPFLKSRTGVEV
jgi:hypothetical protein